MPYATTDKTVDDPYTKSNTYTQYKKARKKKFRNHQQRQSSKK